MQKLVYELNDKLQKYQSAARFMPYPKSKMHLLYMSFNELHYWITVDFQGDQVIIWDSFDENYDSWENISKLYLSKENYDQVIKKWNENVKRPVKYFIFVQDDSGWITLEPKSELSSEDLHTIEQDKQAKIEKDKKQ